MENKDRTELFMKRTDYTFSLSNKTLTSAALYYLLLIGESMTRRDADARSTPMSYPIAYPQSATI